MHLEYGYIVRYIIMENWLARCPDALEQLQTGPGELDVMEHQALRTG